MKKLSLVNLCFRLCHYWIGFTRKKGATNDILTKDFSSLHVYVAEINFTTKFFTKLTSGFSIQTVFTCTFYFSIVRIIESFFTFFTKVQKYIKYSKNQNKVFYFFSTLTSRKLLGSLPGQNHFLSIFQLKFPPEM